MSNGTVKGNVKFFDNVKGWGFLTGQDGLEVFCHVRQVEEDTDLAAGQAVEYQVEQGPKGPRATGVRLVAGL